MDGLYVKCILPEDMDFGRVTESTIGKLFAVARSHDEFSFLFAILGLNSGMEDAGWQPIAETQRLVDDLVGLINAPLHDHTRARMALLLYCHVIEANFIYHCVWNLLLTIEREPPKLFSFLGHYKNGKPPGVPQKIEEIKRKASRNDLDGLGRIFDEIVRADIRNAFFHSDYILYGEELRLKHRSSEYRKIPLEDVFLLLRKCLHFFGTFSEALMKARKSFPKDHVIKNRRSPSGSPLSSVEVLLDADTGIAIGFKSSYPLPLW